MTARTSFGLRNCGERARRITRHPLKRAVLVAGVAVAAMTALAAPAQAQASDDERRFTLTPYIWIATFDADLRFDGLPNTSVEVGPSDYDLNSAFMIAGEARFEPWSVFSDFIYLNITHEQGVARSTGQGPVEIPVDAQLVSDFKGLVWTIAGGYDVIQRERLRLQAFGGVRYVDVEGDLNWTLTVPVSLSGDASRETDAWDAIVGIRGRADAGRWVFPYYVDVGAGESDLTWQASAGVGYRFGWGEVRLDYRALHYDQDEGSLVSKMDVHGPALGATFRF